MRWFKRVRWKTGIAIVGMLLLLVFMVWIPPVSAAGAYDEASGLATPTTVTGQVTPTVDPTMTALEKEKLAQEIDQLKNQNYWAWTTIGPILVGFAGLFAALYSFITWIRNRQDEQKKRDEEQKRWLDDRQAEREKRAEERFQSVVEGLGSTSTATQVGAAIMLRTFLRPGYEQFYSQAFDLAVAYLRLRNIGPEPEPADSLNQALIRVFRESFPLAHDLPEQSSHSLDALGIQLDSAYLARSHLRSVRMPESHLRKANLVDADLREANLREANLSGANLNGANLREANLNGANLGGADLGGAGLSGANLKNANLHGVRGLTKEQLEACKAKGAIIDENLTSSPSQSPVSPSPPSQSDNVQALPTPDAGGSSAASSKSGSQS